jgi:hypothetical protein
MKQIIRPIRWWVHLYTAGLPPRIRDDRRAEIESDLWEQSRFAARQGFGHVAFALAVWTRWLLGIPDDLAWRVEQRATRHLPRDAGRASFATQRASRGRLLRLGLGVTIALVLICMSLVVNTVEYADGTQPGGNVAVVLIALAAAIVAVAITTVARGFSIMRTRPAEGAILVVGGASVAGLAWYWLYVPVVLAMVISVYGISRAMWLIEHNASP